MMNVGKITNINNKKYTGADVLRAAQAEMRKQMEAMQGRPLTQKETAKIDQVATGLSFDVLKRMGVV
ncbi:hypothetical protein HZC34_00130 [Candidatus Saganbacteria bacterium]|nr:hypothetical protein [Candidatus Saganbacteria bacterium]